MRPRTASAACVAGPALARSLAHHACAWPPGVLLRRASLAPGAAPSLAAQGASLAAAFLVRGLDGGDAAVLQRMMGLLVAPLAQWEAPPQVRCMAPGSAGGLLRRGRV